jgi:hypothetical protein
MYAKQLFCRDLPFFDSNINTSRTPRDTATPEKLTIIQLAKCNGLLDRVFSFYT